MAGRSDLSSSSSVSSSTARVAALPTEAGAGLPFGRRSLACRTACMSESFAAAAELIAHIRPHQ